MSQLNRRQWLKSAGLTSAFSLVGGVQAFANPTNEMSPVQASAAAPIRLSSNENPLGPSPKVRQAMIDAFDIGCRYPYSYQGDLVKMIAQKHGVTEDHVVITGGSTEGLKMVGLVYGSDGGEVIAADPTFHSMMNYAEHFGGYVHRVHVDKDLYHDLEAMEQRITQKTSLVYICNPNNPTGTLLSHEKLDSFVRAVADRAMVFVDEAYFDYITEPDYKSCDELVRKGHNVIITRTFSKVYGLAGIRIGYLIARPDIAKRLTDSRMAFTNVLAIKAAEAAMKEEAFYQKSLKINAEAKDMIYDCLDDLKLRYIKSHSNFVFFETGREIGRLINDMLQHGVRIGRPFPPMTQWCRISTGTIPQTQAFVDGLRKVMA